MKTDADNFGWVRFLPRPGRAVLERLDAVTAAEEALANATAALDVAQDVLRKAISNRWTEAEHMAARDAWLDSIGCRCSKDMRRTSAARHGGLHSSGCIERDEDDR